MQIRTEFFIFIDLDREFFDSKSDFSIRVSKIPTFYFCQKYSDRNKKYILKFRKFGFLILSNSNFLFYFFKFIPLLLRNKGGEFGPYNCILIVEFRYMFNFIFILHIFSILYAFIVVTTLYFN